MIAQVDAGAFAWDTQEHQLVRLDAFGTLSGGILSGSYVLTLRAQRGPNTDVPVYRGAVYDLSNLPMR